MNIIANNIGGSATFNTPELLKGKRKLSVNVHFNFPQQFPAILTSFKDLDKQSAEEVKYWATHMAVGYRSPVEVELFEVQDGTNYLTFIFKIFK